MLRAPPAAGADRRARSLEPGHSDVQVLDAVNPRPPSVPRRPDGQPAGVPAPPPSGAAVPLSLRLVFAQDAKGEHIAKGFDKSLVPRLHKLHGIGQDAGVQGGTGAAAGAAASGGVDVSQLTGLSEVRKLTHLMRGRASWPKGTTVEFERRRDWSVAVSVDGEPVLVLEAPDVAWALFDAYVGPAGHFGQGGRAAVVEALRALGRPA